MNRYNKKLADELRKQGYNVRTPLTFKEIWNSIWFVKIIKWLFRKNKK